tara:strand:- start:109159 stop:110487 length:1329 start_codon:yes stop_codon:yes gene_type:complete
MDFKKLISALTKTKETKEIFSKSFTSLWLRVLSYLLGFLFVFFIAKFYSVEAQGVFSITFTLLSLVALISKLGLQTAMIKWLSDYFYNGKDAVAKALFWKIFKLVFILSSILGIILFLLADVLAIQVFKKEGLATPIKIISVSIPFFSSIEIIANYFRSKKNIEAYGFYIFVSKYLIPLVLLISFIFIFSNTNVFPIYAYSVGVIITFIICFIHLFLDLSKIKSTKIESKGISLKTILRTSIPLLFSSSLVMFMWWGDTFILGVYKTESDVGVYSVAVKIATIVSFIYNAVISILMPQIVEFFSNKKEEKLKEVINYSTKLIFITTIPIALVLGLFSKFFLSLFGEVYTEGYIILLLLLLAQLTNSLTGPVGPFLSMCGEEKKQLLFIAIALILNLVISFFLVSDYGGEGVALGSAIGMVTWNILGAVFIRIKYGYQTWVKF